MQDVRTRPQWVRTGEGRRDCAQGAARPCQDPRSHSNLARLSDQIRSPLLHALPGSYDQTVTGGAVIGRILQRSGVSASELARRLGVPEGQVGAWGQGVPRWTLWALVAGGVS